MPSISGAGGGGGGGGWTLLFSSILGAPAASIDTGAAGISGNFTNLRIICLVRASSATTLNTATLLLNNDAGANYDSQTTNGSGTGGATAVAQAGANGWTLNIHDTAATAGYASMIELFFAGYTATTFNKVGTGILTTVDGTAANNRSGSVSLGWRNTAAITRFSIAPAAANLVTGSSVWIYGL